MKRITVSSVRNKDIYHAMALILDASSVTNMVTLLWIVHMRYLLQKLQQFITHLPEVTMPGQVQDTTVKTETGKADQDHNLIFKDTTA